MASPLKQALTILKDMEGNGLTMNSLVATKDVALIVLGDSAAIHKMPGEIIKMWRDNDVLHVMFGHVIADVQIIWQRSFAGFFTLPDAHYTRLQ